MTDVMPDGAARGPRKSPTAYRTISEVSEELQVPQHVLRFWETKFNQVRPLKRGGGRRYYRPEDLELLRTIQALLYRDGYTIKGVQRLLREGRGRVGEAEPEPVPADLFDPTPPTPAPAAAVGKAKHDGAGSGLPAAARRELGAILGDLKSLRAQLVVADED